MITFKKFPAVLVKMVTEFTYSDTVWVICDMNPENFSVQAIRIRWIKGGNILVKLLKSEKSKVVVRKFGSALSAELGERTGGVSEFRHFTKIEILDIDASMVKAEVLAAICVEITGAEDKKSSSG